MKNALFDVAATGGAPVGPLLALALDSASMAPSMLQEDGFDGRAAVVALNI